MSNGGTCYDKIADYTCSCINGWDGKNCQNNIDDYISNPCKNDGTCIDKLNDYECICDHAWEGIICHINVDDCVSNPCLNDGICLDDIGNFTCNCDNTGFTGPLCNIDYNDCLSNPCENDGLCYDTGYFSFECDCTNVGYIGTLCNEEIDAAITMDFDIDRILDDDELEINTINDLYNKLPLVLAEQTGNNAENFIITNNTNNSTISINIAIQSNVENDDYNITEITELVADSEFAQGALNEPVISQYNHASNDNDNYLESAKEHIQNLGVYTILIVFILLICCAFISTLVS